MPVTARLSQKFYQTLGDEVANELVDWFNEVDRTYRGELRELSELNFARFDAKIEQRTAELRQAIADTKSELLKWMFLFWVGNVATTIGVAATLVGLRKS